MNRLGYLDFESMLVKRAPDFSPKTVVKNFPILMMKESMKIEEANDSGSNSLSPSPVQIKGL